MEHRDVWTVDDALAFAEALIADRHLEVKVGRVSRCWARYRREFRPALLPAWKRWLAQNHSANWGHDRRDVRHAHRSAGGRAS
jgi:hypothetical protein